MPTLYKKIVILKGPSPVHIINDNIQPSLSNGLVLLVKKLTCTHYTEVYNTVMKLNNSFCWMG